MGTCGNFASKAEGTPSASSTLSTQRRSAILLIGGDKTGNDRFYKRYVLLADKLYDKHLKELKQEGLIE